jgi:hypothetical protein
VTPEQKIARLTTWLNTYPPLPDDVSGDPELMVVQTVRRLLFTDVPIEVAGTGTRGESPGVHVADCRCLVSDGAVLNVDLRCEVP